MFRTINISISPKGDVSFEIKGVKGNACLKETEFLEKALGGGVISREETDEYYSDYQLVTDEDFVKTNE